jgi:hypothetical protein
MAYAAVGDIRALDGISTSKYTDATVQSAIDWATKRIDDYCGTSFEYKTFTITLDGNNHTTLFTSVLFIRSITAVTIDGVAVSSPGTKFSGTATGAIHRIDGDFYPASMYGQGENVVITGTAGVTSAAPEDIKWACRTMARQWLLDLHSRTPDRSIQMANEFGQFVMAQSGGQGRPTSLPDVNTVLNQNKHKPGMAGAVIS